MKKLVWLTDIDTTLEIFELALKHGKKPGESMQEEFIEIYKQKKEKFQLIGCTEQDIDMLTGNLREEGKKILNLNEIERRKQ
jgi:hypothetical protein